jgi:hypothetical protein
MASRFMNIEKLKDFQQRILFNKKATKELVNEAVISLVNAKRLHDELEKLYTDAVDFDKVNKKTIEILEKL